MSAHYGAVVLARMGSSRFPGKALFPLRGKPLVQYMVDKAAAVGIEPVVAMTREAGDDALEAYCQSQGFATYRGDTNDVPARCIEAADTRGYDAMIRMNADNPLLPVPVLRNILEIYDTGRWDYVSNCIERTFPYGMSAEIMRTEALRDVAQRTGDAFHREHVTSFFRLHPQEYRTFNVRCPFDGKGLQLAVDSREDAKLVEVLLEALHAPHDEAGIDEIAAVIASNHKLIPVLTKDL